jgi:hypothetical protein
LLIGMHLAASRNRVPIGAGCCVRGQRLDPRFHERREERFKMFCLAVHLVPRHFERIAEETSEKATTAEDLRASRCTFIGQMNNG